MKTTPRKSFRLTAGMLLAAALCLTSGCTLVGAGVGAATGAALVPGAPGQGAAMGAVFGAITGAAFDNAVIHEHHYIRYHRVHRHPRRRHYCGW